MNFDPRELARRTETEPRYDGSPLTGHAMPVLNDDGETFTLCVGNQPWHECIHGLQHARQQCAAAIESLWQRAANQNLPKYRLPLGATLDRVPAAGQLVTLQIVDGRVQELYWTMVQANYENRAPKEVETFMAVEGRVRIPGVPSFEWRHVMHHAAEASSERFTTCRSFDRDFELADTVEAYTALTALAEAVEFLSDDSLLQPPEREGGVLPGL